MRDATRRVLREKYGDRGGLAHLGALRRATQYAQSPQSPSEPPGQRQQGTPQRWVMKSASKVVRVPYTLPLVALATWALWKADRRSDAAYLLGVLGVAQAADGLLKQTVGERRPEQGGAGRQPNSSFLSRSSPYRLVAVLLGPGVSMLSGVSWLYFRRHHVRDVLVGWAIGVLVAVVGRVGHDRLISSRGRN